MKKTHPNLYRMYVTYAVLSTAIGLNFLLLHPAFTPLAIPKWSIGVVFLGCGVLKMALLGLDASARSLRLSMGLTVAIMSFWAMALTYDFFRFSQTSLQLPLVFILAATIAFWLLFEPFINPATKKD